MKHYRVFFEEAKEPEGITTACSRSCMCCGLVLCGMGGGAEHICQQCLDDLRMGDMGDIRFLRYKVEELSKKIDDCQKIKNALRPFAEFAITLERCPQGSLLPGTATMLGSNSGVSGPTVGDCRTAAELVFGGVWRDMGKKEEDQ